MKRKTDLEQLKFLVFPMLALLLAGCANEGDLGRDNPSYITRTVTDVATRVRTRFARDEDRYLPLTAAEDALRQSEEDIEAMCRGGFIANVVPPLGGNGYARAETVLQDMRVDRERFQYFARAAEKVLQIDEARDRRLRNMDALGAKRQLAAAERRRLENDRLIREGVGLMRIRVKAYKRELERIKIGYPDVPLQELEVAYDELNEDVVRFHAMFDERAFRRLGGSGKLSYK